MSRLVGDLGRLHLTSGISQHILIGLVNLVILHLELFESNTALLSLAMASLSLADLSDVLHSGVKLLFNAFVAGTVHLDGAGGALRRNCIVLRIVKLQRVLLGVSFKVPRKAGMVRLVQCLLILILGRARLLEFYVQRLRVSQA